MNPGFNGADLFRILGSFVLVLALMAALLWALRRLQFKITNQNPQRKLQIVELISVGTRQKLALVRVGDHEVLIGISPTQITALTGEMATKSNGLQSHSATPELTSKEASNVA